MKKNKEIVVEDIEIVISRLKGACVSSFNLLETISKEGVLEDSEILALISKTTEMVDSLSFMEDLKNTVESQKKVVKPNLKIIKK